MDTQGLLCEAERTVSSNAWRWVLGKQMWNYLTYVWELEIDENKPKAEHAEAENMVRYFNNSNSDFVLKQKGKGKYCKLVKRCEIELSEVFTQVWAEREATVPEREIEMDTMRMGMC